jgi:LDH2 family malate/lactate/ureidoglycolate dehydrogenase
LILPMAGAKGYVIAFMMDVLAGVLTGSGFGDSVVGPYDPGRPSGCGHLLVTIDVAALTTLAEFEARMETLIDATKAVEGIPITDDTWTRLVALADQTGTALPHAVTGRTSMR